MKPQDKPLIGDNVSKIVKILLVRDEMLQQDLAEALGYDAGTVTRKMKGLREWRLNDVVRLAEFFEVPVSLFFEDPQHIMIRVATTESDSEPGNHLIMDQVLVAA